MKLSKIFRWLTAGGVCLLLVITGCAPAGREPTKPQAKIETQMPEAATVDTVDLTLKFAPQDSTKYKATTEIEMSVNFEGSFPADVISRNGRNSNKVEMLFTQTIQSIDDKGYAAAKITIEGLKYLSIYKNNPVIDFDSSRQEDRSNPLNKLVGQSYTIEITPDGQITKVVDANQARTAVGGDATANKTALNLLDTDVIMKRHEISALPGTYNAQLHTGDNWSSIQTFSFPIVGSKAYERVYTLKEIKTQDNHKTAIVDMNAIPSSEVEEQSSQEQVTSPLSKMFDSTGPYTGRLELDLTTGKIEKYFEELRSEWIAVDPDAKQNKDEEPAVVKMGAVRSHSLEKVN